MYYVITLVVASAVAVAVVPVLWLLLRLHVQARTWVEVRRAVDLAVAWVEQVYVQGELQGKTLTAAQANLAKRRAMATAYLRMGPVVRASLAKIATPLDAVLEKEVEAAVRRLPK